jgi:hypothetical protein
MNYLHVWLTLSGSGIVFALFPAYISTASILYEAILVQKKKPSRWICEIFFINHEYPEGTIWARGPRSTRKIAWNISVVYVVLFLCFYQYFGIINNFQIDILTILIGETSFPVFLLLTWLLPVYFMKRYLKKVKSGDEVDRNTYYDYD